MVGCIIVTHQSEIRPTGFAALERCINSLEFALGDSVDITIVDNGSSEAYTNPRGYDYIYRPEQLNGLTGAWNMGVFMAYEKGHDLFCLISDDVFFQCNI